MNVIAERRIFQYLYLHISIGLLFMHILTVGVYLVYSQVRSLMLLLSGLVLILDTFIDKLGLNRLKYKAYFPENQLS